MALRAVVMQAYVEGVSTRRVDDLVTAMGGTGISKSEVSKVCAQLDADVAVWRSRTLEHTAFPYVFLDASYCKMSDADLHLVLSDAAGRTLVVEIPAPSCVGATSPWRASITAARRTFLSRCTPTSSFTYASKHVAVTVVGFYDRLHGQSGMAPNGLELHAVTGITF